MPRWLDTAILYVTVFAAAAVSVTLASPFWVAEKLRPRPKVRVEPLPNPPWSTRDQRVAVERARKDWLR